MPDLVFFGDSYTTRPERIVSNESHGGPSVQKFSLVWLSYGRFVRYSMATQLKEVVVVCSSGICMEEKDLNEGGFAIFLFGGGRENFGATDS
ncbi:hypothetical protein OIU76_001992 [Salix suchowensis]|uniref:Uncharacterized protein n=1 Tax=Salix suchowensis TaxID=1278906 RepID=A0ABQ9CJT9_9ROSI|nr:hypothetical protein OIU76_001992 [Salix suchowensis]KAJ6398802.1 hypothetical protein OIU77_019550 [Salix suchowensis]